MGKARKVSVDLGETNENFENEFDNIDDGDLSKSGSDEVSKDPKYPPALSPETKEGDPLPAPVKVRERRKMPTIEELRQAARMLPYEDRAVVIAVIREDMGNDIWAEQATEEKAAEEKKQKIERLNALKGGL